MARFKGFAFLLCLLLPLQGWASFSETSRRYLSPRDLFNVLGQKFPVVSNLPKIRTLKPTCWMIGDFNINLIGSVNPAVGAPAAAQPVTGFVRWLGTCGGSLVKLQFEELAAKPGNEKLWLRFFPEGFRAKHASELDKTNWSSLDQDERDSVLRYQIETLIGPDAVIKDLGFADGTEALLKVVQKSAAQGTTISQAAQQSLLALILREEFISY